MIIIRLVALASGRCCRSILSCCVRGSRCKDVWVDDRGRRVDRARRRLGNIVVIHHLGLSAERVADRRLESRIEQLENTNSEVSTHFAHPFYGSFILSLLRIALGTVFVSYCLLLHDTARFISRVACQKASSHIRCNSRHCIAGKQSKARIIFFPVKQKRATAITHEAMP